MLGEALFLIIGGEVGDDKGILRAEAVAAGKRSYFAG